MTDQEYVPPKVWTWNKESGGRFASDQPPGRRADA
jgi:GSH-dependent disulfide-bond oxidoreductase